MLRNDCHGTALTLSAEDHRTISGAVYDPRESPYQTVSTHFLSAPVHLCLASRLSLIHPAVDVHSEGEV